jgi:hypothetical protein
MRRCPALLLATVTSLASGCDTGQDDRERIAELENKVQVLEGEVLELRHLVEELEGRLEEEKPPLPFLKRPGKFTKLGARCEEVEGRFLLTPEEAGEVRGNREGILASMRILPSPLSDGIQGLKLYGIRKDSFAGSCGFHNGDLVVEINGMSISEGLYDPVMNPLKLDESIRKDREARIKIIRQGEDVELTIGVSQADQ